jgi:Spy/CpxP family protein refolding chaperone
MKKSIALGLLGGSLLLLQGAGFAQSSDQTVTVTDQDIHMLREDMRSDKKQIIAANMNLTATQATKFWPVYDAYSQETKKLQDNRYALIKEYAQAYDNMTDAQALSLTKRASALDESNVQLRQQWIPKFSAVLTPKQTAVFFQLDRRIALIVDFQLASIIPLAKQ